MRNISDKSCREDQSMFMINNSFPEKHAVNGIMWENLIGPDRPEMILHAAFLKLQTHTQNM